MRLLLGSLLLIAMCVAGWQTRTIAQENPLDQLRDRSAESRWKTLRERFSDRRDERSEKKVRRKQEEAPTEPATSNRAPSPAEVAAEPTPRPTVKPDANPLPAGNATIFVPEPIPSQPRLPVPGMPQERSARPTQPEITPPEISQQELPQVADVGRVEVPLYQELFQLGEPLTESSAKDVVLKTDPHPGLIDVKIVSQAKTEPTKTAAIPSVGSKSRSSDNRAQPGLLPPLPSFSNQELDNSDRLALQPGLQPMPRPLTNSRQGSIRDYLFASGDYVKPMEEIAPFNDYEPNKEMREKDPYRNLCPPPADYVADEFHCPEMSPLPNADQLSERNFAHLDYHWKPTNGHYFPLYFEDVGLERYGHIHRPVVQPFVSIAKFSGQLLALPYQMTMHEINEPTYPLGYHQPGDAGVPKLYYQPPINLQAAAVTVGVYTGWFYIIP